MSVPFNVDEVFEMAEQIERNGAVYYRQAADLFSEPTINDFLTRLALMEDEHERTFAGLRRQLLERPEWTDLDEMATSYVRALVSGKVFDINRDVTAFFMGDESIGEILQRAILLEKESVVFYTGIKELVPADFGRDKIDAIIQEEMKHIVFLNDQLSKLP